MLEGIKLSGELFNHEDDYDFIDTMTKNMIFICDSPHTKRKLYNAFEDICDGKCVESRHDYYVNKEDELYPKITRRIVEYLPTVRFVIDNEQIITITIEAPFVFTAKSIEDIWFAESNNDNTISVYPMECFKGSHNKWDEGLNEVYKYVTQGRYGGYEGYWMEKESLGDISNFGTITDGKFKKNLDYPRE